VGRGSRGRSVVPWRLAAGVTVLALALTGCSDSGSDGATDTTTTVRAPDGRPMADADAATLAKAVDDAGSCDVLDSASCLLPFPSSHFTSGSGKDLHVELPTGQLANDKGTTFDPTAWNRNDGFSPVTPILTSVPGVDPEASSLPPIGDIGRSMDKGSGSVLVDLDTGERLAHWAELDAGAPDDAHRLLIIRPAKALPEGHRIAVGLVGLKDSSGKAIEPSLAFRAYRDALTTEIDGIEQRRDEMDGVLAALAKVGVDRKALTLAWDFPVASQENLSGPMVHMRDTAFDQLGEAAPTFTVDEVQTAELQPGIARLVRGTFQVPSFLTGAGEPGSTLQRGDDGKPALSGSSISAAYSCQVPQVAIDEGKGSARPVVYGHGLLGSHTEVENSQVAKIASTNNMIYCATDWIGMSREDLGNAVTILGDISKFPSLADRSQQGILDALFLARLMIHDKGFGSDAAFQAADGSSLIDGTEAYYDGNSQGAIIGGAATAVATDWKHAVLGVPGMNYSLLLNRSVDFDKYFAVLDAAYPDRVEQQIIYGVLQMLWDRGETSGYAQHITTDPLPGTPEHKVILDVAFGDHQVAQVAAEVEARTIGARLRTPALADGRHPDAKPFFGLEPIEKYPFDGSALIYWDAGTLPPPETNTTPQTGAAWDQACGALSEDQADNDAKCADSHEDPRRQPGSIRQKDSFFRPDGKIIDACDGKPCVATPRFQLDY